MNFINKDLLGWERAGQDDGRAAGGEVVFQRKVLTGRRGSSGLGSVNSESLRKWEFGAGRVRGLEGRLGTWGDGA